MTSHSSLPILVIGSGIAAAATTLALRRAHYIVHWYITPSMYQGTGVLPGLMIPLRQEELTQLHDWMVEWSLPATLVQYTTCQDVSGNTRHAGVVDIRALAEAMHAVALAAGEPNEEGPDSMLFLWDDPVQQNRLHGITRPDGSELLAAHTIQTLDSRPLLCVREEPRTDQDTQVQVVALDEEVPVYRVPFGDQVYILEREQQQPTHLHPGVRPEQVRSIHGADWAVQRAAPGFLITSLDGGNGLLGLPWFTGEELLRQVRGSDAD